MWAREIGPASTINRQQGIKIALSLSRSRKKEKDDQRKKKRDSIPQSSDARRVLLSCNLDSKQLGMHACTQSRPIPSHPIPTRRSQFSPIQNRA